MNRTVSEQYNTAGCWQGLVSSMEKQQNEWTSHGTNTQTLTDRRLVNHLLTHSAKCSSLIIVVVDSFRMLFEFHAISQTKNNTSLYMHWVNSEHWCYLNVRLESHMRSKSDWWRGEAFIGSAFYSDLKTVITDPTVFTVPAYCKRESNSLHYDDTDELPPVLDRFITMWWPIWCVQCAWQAVQHKLGLPPTVHKYTV